jgi:hypothetical protein
MAAFNQFIAAGVDLGFYGVLDSTGYLNGNSLTAPAAGDAAGAPMLRVRGVIGADTTVPEPEVVNVPGDNGSQGNFLFGSDESPAFTIEKSVFDQTFNALAQGTKTLAVGDITLGVLQPNSPNWPDICFILQSDAKRKGGTSDGVRGWAGYIIPVTSVQPLGRDNFATRAAASDRLRVAANPASLLPTGGPINETAFGTDGGPIIDFTADNPVTMHRFTGDGTETVFQLAYTPVSAAKTHVYVNGTKLAPTTDYTVSTTTREITLTAAPANSTKIVVLYEFTR